MLHFIFSSYDRHKLISIFHKMELNFKKCIRNILFELSSEINKDENMLMIRNDILNPIISQILDEIQPYFIKLIVVIVSITIFLIITIILNLRVILYRD